MNPPDLPDAPTFRTPTAAERPWWWRLHDASGAETHVDGDLGDQRFSNQGDAESWVGETWAALAELGVAAVTLVEVDRAVYGPMPLTPG